MHAQKFSVDVSNLLAAFLFGQKLESEQALQVFKALGIYHTLVFSGFQVGYWTQFLRRVLSNVIDGRRAWITEGLILGFLSTLYFVFDHDWSSKRAVLFSLGGLIVGYQNPPWRWILGTQIFILVGLFVFEPEAYRSMGVWMSLSGSVLLSNSQSWGPESRASQFLLHLFVASGQWLIAQYFGVSYSLLASIGLGLFLEFFWNLIFRASLVSYPFLIFLPTLNVFLTQITSVVVLRLSRAVTCHFFGSQF